MDDGALHDRRVPIRRSCDGRLRQAAVEHVHGQMVRRSHVHAAVLFQREKLHSAQVRQVGRPHELCQQPAAVGQTGSVRLARQRRHHVSDEYGQDGARHHIEHTAQRVQRQYGRDSRVGRVPNSPGHVGQASTRLHTPRGQGAPCQNGPAHLHEHLPPTGNRSHAKGHQHRQTDFGRPQTRYRWNHYYERKSA